MTLLSIDMHKHENSFQHKKTTYSIKSTHKKKKKKTSPSIIVLWKVDTSDIRKRFLKGNKYLDDKQANCQCQGQLIVERNLATHK